MKQFNKFIKSLALMFVILLSSFSIVSCLNSKSNTNTPSANTTTDSDISNETTIEINEKDNFNQENEYSTINLSSLNGIYKATKIVTFDDALRSNSEEVIKYFETRDFNGVYNAIKQLGFNDYNPLKFIESTNSLYEEMFYIKNNMSTTMTYSNDVYSLYKNEVIDLSSIISNIQFNKNTNEYTLDAAFVYKNSKTSELVITPLKFRVTIKEVEFSKEVLDGINCKYKTHSAIVNIDNNDNLIQPLYEAKLAKIFGLESSTDVFDDVVNILKSYDYIIADDSSRFTVIYKTEKVDSIAFCNLTADHFFNIADFSIKLESHTYNLETKKDEFTLSISIQNEIKLTFQLVSK